MSDDDDELANAIYVALVNPDTTWWDDLTPDMQEGYRRAARVVRRMVLNEAIDHLTKHHGGGWFVSDILELRDG